MATPKIIPYQVKLRSTTIERSLVRPIVYTNDLRSAEFQFQVTDMQAGELSGATATTLLYMRDGSFFQNPKEDVELTGTTFSYLLKEDEGNHAGIARIQLVVRFNEGLEDEQNFPSQLYDFEIVNGLETQVAQQIMIHDWTTLTREARAYIDEFAANEILREAEFDNNEFDRNAAFNLAQTNRQNQFSDLTEDLTATLAAADANIEEFDVALQNGIVAANLAEKLEDFEEINNSRLLSTERQLEQTGNRIDDIITTPVPVGEILVEEIIDARQGLGSLGTNISAIKGDVANMLTLGKNKLNLAGLTSGFYVNYTHGGLSTGADFGATGYVPLLPNTTYTLSSLVSMQQFALYDNDETFLEGNVGGANPVVFTTPATCAYGRFTIRLLNLEKNNQLEIGSVPTTYEPYQKKINVSAIEKGKLSLGYFTEEIQAKLGKNVIVVKQDGTGDFLNLRQATESITDASALKQYEIQIHEGVYDVMGDYSVAEIDSASFYGIPLNDYVSLRGIGQKNKIVIKGELAETFSGTTVQRVSTICKYGTGDIENITITAKNLRYAVHDDYNYPNLKRKVTRCDFLKYAGGGNPQAYGGGTREGMVFEFAHCYFHTETSGVPFSFHNNINLTTPSHIKLVNCTAANQAGQYAIRFGSMGSGVEDTLELIGCKLSGAIRLTEEQSNGVGIDYRLSGYGNDIVPVNVNVTDGKQYVYELVGDTKRMVNGSGVTTILKGEPVKLNSFGSAISKLTDSSTHLFYGIALQDILPNTSGVVKVGGYLAISDTSLVGLVVGDKIGISSGVLAKVTGADYIGSVTINDYIRLNKP